MASGHTSKGDRSRAELDDMLAYVMANPKIRRRLAQPFTLSRKFDIALLGSSATDGKTVYLDRHLPVSVKVGKRPMNVTQPLIRHERLEQAIEDIYGWPYILAHDIAEHWEEQLVTQMGIDPKAYEKALEPWIKKDEHAKVTKVPADLDLRPVLSGADPEDKSILKNYKAVVRKRGGRIGKA